MVEKARTFPTSLYQIWTLPSATYNYPALPIIQETQLASADIKQPNMSEVKSEEK